jgi:hypothetical protein
VRTDQDGFYRSMQQVVVVARISFESTRLEGFRAA